MLKLIFDNVALLFMGMILVENFSFLTEKKYFLEFMKMFRK